MDDAVANGLMTSYDGSNSDGYVLLPALLIIDPGLEIYNKNLC